jgi:hypothetical protein
MGINRRKGMKKCVFALFLCVSLIVVSAAGAGTIETSRSSLGANDLIDWNQVPVGINTGPLTVTSNLGMTATVTDTLSTPPLPPDSLGKATQVNIATYTYPFPTPPTDWVGNFATGDNVLYTNSATDNSFSNPSVMEIRFTSPVKGVGAQIEISSGGQFFYGVLTVYDASNNLLGTYTSLVGNTFNAQNNPPEIFLGVLDATADISKIDYSVFALLGSDHTLTDPIANRRNDPFAINQLSILTGAPVPIPPTALLLGSGLLGLAGFGWRRKKNQSA